MLKNYMEEAVDLFLPSLLANYENICRCNRCLDDMRAIALNHLRPAYYVSEKGELFNKTHEMAIQYRADIVSELTRAIVIVYKNPSHGEAK